MPKYRVTDSFTGATIVVEGDSPPTESEAQALLEQAYKPKLTDFLESAAAGMVRGVGGLAQLADLATGGGLSELANRVLGTTGTVGGELEQLARDVGSIRSPGLQLRQQAYQETEGLVPKTIYAATHPSLIGSTLAESLAQMVPSGLALGPLARALRPQTLAGLVEGLTQAGSALSEAEAIKGEPLTAGETILPLASGAVTGTIGRYSANVARRLGLGNVEQLLVPGAPLQPKPAFAGRALLRGAATEGLLEEAPQTVSEAIFSQIERNILEGQPPLSEVTAETIFEEVPLATLTGFASGGLAQVPGILRPSRPYDQKDQGRIQGGKQIGQEPRGPVPKQIPGGEATAAGGVLQASRALPPGLTDEEISAELELYPVPALPAGKEPLALPPGPGLPARTSGLSPETEEFYGGLQRKPWQEAVPIGTFLSEVPATGDLRTDVERARAFFQQRSASFPRNPLVLTGYHDTSSASLPSLRIPAAARNPRKALRNELARSVSVTLLQQGRGLSPVERRFVSDVEKVRLRLRKVRFGTPAERKAAAELLKDAPTMVGAIFTNPMFGRLFGPELQARLVRAFRDAVFQRVLPGRPVALLAGRTESAPVNDWFRRFMTEKPLWTFLRSLIPNANILLEPQLRHRLFRGRLLVTDFEALNRAATEHFGQPPLTPEGLARLRASGLALTFEHARGRPELYFDDARRLVVNLARHQSESDLFRTLQRLNNFVFERRRIEVPQFLEELRRVSGFDGPPESFLREIEERPRNLGVRETTELLLRYISKDSTLGKVIQDLSNRLEALAQKASAAGIERKILIGFVYRPGMTHPAETVSADLGRLVLNAIDVNLHAIGLYARDVEHYFKLLGEAIAHEYAHALTGLLMSRGRIDDDANEKTPYSVFYNRMREFHQRAAVDWFLRKAEIIETFGLDEEDIFAFEYGLTDENEFIAVFFQSDKFRDWLNSIPVPRRTTVFETVIDSVAQFLGIKDPYSLGRVTLEEIIHNVEAYGNVYSPEITYNQLRFPHRMFSGWAPANEPPASTLVPDFGSFKAHKAVFFVQQLWGGMYWLQRFLGGPVIFRKLAFMLPGDREKNISGMSAIVAWFAEKYGIATALVNRFTYLLPHDIDDVFKVNPETGDVEGVVPLKPELSTKLGDILDAEDPLALYKFTPKQEEYLKKYVLPALKQKDELLKKYNIDRVLDENGEPFSRVARVVVQRPEGKETRAHRSSAPRVFLTEADGWAAGVVYSPSIRERLRETLRFTYRTIADKRLVDDLRTNLAWTPAQKEAELRAKFPQATEAQIRRTVEGLKVKGKVHHHIFEGMYFDEEVANLLNREIAYMPSKLRDGVARANAALKAFETGFDLGVGMIQLGVLFRHRPVVWARAMLSSVLELLNPGTAAEFFRKHDDTVRELAEFGSPIGELPDIAEGMRRGEIITKIPGVRGIAYRFGLQLRTALDVAKVLLWEIHRKNPQLSLFDKIELIRTIEAEIGTARFESDGIHRNRVLLERVLFYSTAYYRAQINLVATALAAKSEAARMEALKALGSYAFVQVLLFVAVGLALGMDEDDLVDRLNPVKTPKFMFWEFEVEQGQKVVFGTGGLYLAMMRMLGHVWRLLANDQGYKLASLKADDNPLVRFYIGHASPLISRTVAALTGRTYLKERVDLSSMRTAQRLLPTPFWAQDESAPGALISFLGGSAYLQKREPYGEAVKRITGAESPNEATMLQLMQVGRELRRGPRRTPEEQELAVAGATDIAYRATVDIMNSLPKTQRKFLERHRLSLPLTPMQVNRAGVTVPLNPDQERKYKAYIVEEYRNAINYLMASPTLARWMQEGSLQNRLDRLLEVARNRARARLLSEELRSAPAGSSNASAPR